MNQINMKNIGLNSRMIEKEKLNAIFSEVGGMNNARKTLKEKKRKKDKTSQLH